MKYETVNLPKGASIKSSNNLTVKLNFDGVQFLKDVEKDIFRYLEISVKNNIKNNIKVGK